MPTADDFTRRTFGHRCRAAALGAILGLALLVAAGVTAQVLTEQASALLGRPRLTVDDAVPLIALAVLVAGLLWLAVLVAVSSHDLLRQGSPRRRVLSPAARGPLATRVAGLLLAVTAFGSVATAGGASAHPVTSVSTLVGAGSGDARPAPVPDFAPAEPASGTTPQECQAPEPGWTSGGPALQRRSSTDQAGLLDRCASRSGDEVVVHRGDSLWSIVERELGADAGPREIAARWPQWYAANRDAIGTEPDLLRPGTVLHRPSQGVLR